VHQNTATNNKQLTTSNKSLNPKSLHIEPRHVHLQCVFYTIQNPDCIGLSHVNVTCVFMCTRTSIFASLTRAQKKSEARWRVGPRQLDIYIYIHIYIYIYVYIYVYICRFSNQIQDLLKSTRKSYSEATIHYMFQCIVYTSRVVCAIHAQGHANLLLIVPSLMDDPRRESSHFEICIMYIYIYIYYHRRQHFQWSVRCTHVI